MYHFTVLAKRNGGKRHEDRSVRPTVFLVQAEKLVADARERGWECAVVAYVEDDEWADDIAVRSRRIFRDRYPQG